MDRKTTTSIRGILAILIILHHLGEYNVLLFNIFSGWGGRFSVGVFFFFSGYNLAYNSEIKEDYLKNFILKKFVKVFIPAFLSYFIYFLIDNGIRARFFINFLSIRYGCEYYWFAKAIIIYYISYYVIYKFMRNHNMIIIGLIVWLFAGVGIFSMNVFFLDRVYSLSFIGGWIIAIKREKIYQVFKNNYIIMVLEICLIILMGVLAFAGFIEEFVFMYLGSFIFALLAYSISCTYCLDNDYLIKIGSISYEIYLTHSIMMKICVIYKLGDICFMFSVFVVGFNGAILLSKMVNYLYGNICEYMTS